MASEILYPPIVDSSAPAFVAGDNCRIYFSLSKFNAFEDFKSVHISIFKQGSNVSVVNEKLNSLNRYRSTGVILNAKASSVDNVSNLYYVDIYNEDLKSESNGYKGWIPGWIYKIQLRLSKFDYDESDKQSSWLVKNASNFSEWSTVCITKAIGNTQINIPNFGFETDKPISKSYMTEMNFYGTYSCLDKTETLYSYRVKTELEDSGICMAKPQDDTTYLQHFSYIFKKEYNYDEEYNLEFTYETKNKYTNTIKIPFIVEKALEQECNIYAITFENNPTFMKEYTSIQEEEEEGRIGIKLYSEENEIYTGGLCIRRTNSKSQFNDWEDFKIISLHGIAINDYPIIYDYTAESGIAYKYGVQIINTLGVRSSLIKSYKTALRDYNHSFLLGENEQQLKLMFNNNINSYKISLDENRQDTIGGKYSHFNRNGNTYYKTFPITGLISYNMDEKNLFESKTEIYGNSNIQSIYEEYNFNNNVYLWNDRLHEKLFREKVITFLYDGKPKLFKSTTEGNILIRLMDISFTPNQALSRQIYDFSATAYEIGESNLEDFLKYNLTSVGEYNIETMKENEFRSKIISLTVLPNENIITYLKERLGSNGEPVAGGFIENLESISNLSIVFNSDPYPIQIDNNIYNGYNMVYNNKNLIAINNIYNFGENVELNVYKDTLIMKSDNAINLTITCDYLISKEIYISENEKAVLSKSYNQTYGQIYDILESNTDILNIIDSKYYIKNNKMFISIYKITEIEFETVKNAIFKVNGTNHIIGETGILHLSDDDFTEIEYLGVQTSEGISLNSNLVLVTYKYTLLTKIYKE